MAHYSKERKTKSGILYWFFGEEKNAPIFLIPGFTGTHKDVSDIANLLKEKYFVIVPEFPGWENAAMEKSPYTIHAYAKIIKDITHDMNLRKVPIIAHCMGAVVALEVAYDFPENVKELILISTPYLDGTLGRHFFLLMANLSEKVPRTFRPIFFFWRSRIITTPISFFVFQTKTFRKKLSLIFHVLINQQSQNEHVLETNWESLIKYDYQKLSHVQIPIHLLHGENDMLIPPSQAERLTQLLPDASFELIPHAGHLPPVETPETTARLIEKYLSS